MKKILKGIFIPIIIAVLLGYVLGKYVYKTYNDKMYVNLSSSKLYLIENGEYEDMISMREDNGNNNYVYYVDNNKYKSIVGITKNYDNMEKIKKLYNDNVLVLDYYIQNDKLDSRQDEYEKELDKASDMDDVREVVNNIINLYRNDDKIRLISIN